MRPCLKILNKKRISRTYELFTSGIFRFTLLDCTFLQVTETTANEMGDRIEQGKRTHPEQVCHGGICMCSQQNQETWELKASLGYTVRSCLKELHKTKKHLSHRVLSEGVSQKMPKGHKTFVAEM